MTFDPEKVLSSLRGNQPQAPSSKSSRSSSIQHRDPTASNRGSDSATPATPATRRPATANPSDGRTYSLLSRAFREYGIVVKVSGSYIDMSSHTEPPDDIVDELIKAKPDIIRVLGESGVSAEKVTRAQWLHDYAWVQHRVEIALSGRTLTISKADQGEPPAGLMRRIEALESTFHRLLPTIRSKGQEVTEGAEVSEGYFCAEGEGPGAA